MAAPSSDDEPRPLLRGVRRALWAPAVGLIACVIAGRLGDRHWTLDLLSHFQVQYAAIAGVGVLLCALVRATGPALLTATSLALSGAATAPLLLDPEGSSGASEERVRVAALNVKTSNRGHAAAATWLREQSADVLVVQEVDSGWMAALEAELPDHTRIPTETARDDNFGIGVWVANGASWSDLTVHTSPASTPWIEVVVATAAPAIRVMAVHTVPPMGAPNTRERDQHLRDIFERAAQSGEPVVIAGDLNATIWSSELARTLEASGFRAACLGRGLQGTWHSRIASFTGGILIDHILLDPRLVTIEFAVGRDVGSDHRGVAAEIGWR